ncbi:MAG: OmpH family outer membrane protein [Rhodoferax sp.]
MKTRTTQWLVGMLMAWAALAQAQESKIGFINTQRITQESTPAKAAQGKLEQEFSKRQKELADLQTSIKSFNERFEREAPTLSESQRAARQREFAEMNRDFQRKQREFQEDLNSRRNEELQQVLDKANRAVKQVAEAEKYDMILQDGVAYNNGRHDITDKVLKVLNGLK